LPAIEGGNKSKKQDYSREGEEVYPTSSLIERKEYRPPTFQPRQDERSYGKICRRAKPELTAREKV